PPPPLGPAALPPVVPLLDPDLTRAEPAIEGAAQHHILDPQVEAGAAERGPVIGAANLQDAAIFVDTEEAGHAGQFVAVEQDERAVAAGASIERDAVVEAIGSKIIGIDLPDFAILGASGLQRLAIMVAK